MKKAQATVEYLVLLAVAIIIALVIFGFMGWIPGMAGGLRERQVRMYWASMWPLSIKDYKVTSGAGSTFLIQNLADSKIIITAINASGSGGSVSPSSYQLVPGEAKQYTQAGINCSTVGLTYEIGNTSISYDVVDGISGQVERGDRPLIGKCT